MSMPPRRIRQLPPALPAKDSDVFPVSQMGEDGKATTRAMQRAQFQSDIIEVINAARQEFVDTANAEHEVLRQRLTDVEAGLEANALNDEQMQAVLVMVQQMVNGESGKTPYDLWLEAGHTGSLQDYLNSLVGPRGPQGIPGESIKGDRGERGETGASGVGIQGPTGSPGKDGVDGKPGERGPAGSDAAATPLATQMAKALGNAAVGTSDRAAREDHVHPMPAGRLVLVGNVTISKTLLLGLGAGMTREDVTLTGITTADQGKLLFSTITPCQAGCEAINIYAKSANTLTVAYNLPALAVGAVINIPLAIYRVV